MSDIQNELSLFNNNINNIFDKLNNTQYEIDKKNENKKIFSLIEKYLKDNNKKIGGSFSLNLYLKKKDNTIDIYKNKINNNTIIDIDFYSFCPIEDLKNLCDILHNNNIKFVRGSEAIHKESYKLTVNNITYCNISYMPKYIYYNIPSEIINEFTLVSPFFMNIDYLRILTDPLNSYWRLHNKNTYERYLLLNSNYINNYIQNNYEDTDIKDNKDNKNIKNDVKNILNIFSQKNTIINIGQLVYNIYDNLTNNKNNNINLFEFISINYETDLIELFNILKTINIDNISHDEYYPFFQFFGESVKIYYNNIPICILYSHNNKAIPYKQYNNINIASYHTCLLFANINAIKYQINNDYYNYKNEIKYIKNISEIRNVYFSKNNLTNYDESIFQDFIIDTLGISISPEKERQIIGELRKKNNKPFMYAYDPILNINSKNNKDNKDNYVFSNTSGNLKKAKKFDLKYV